MLPGGTDFYPLLAKVGKEIIKETVPESPFATYCLKKDLKIDVIKFVP
jgi:hypothetical protein